jgi:hypothetical protein
VTFVNTLGLFLMVSHIIRFRLNRKKTKGADCDTDHCMAVAKLKERIPVSKRARQKFNLGRFYLRKLDDVDVKGKYQVEI